MSTIVMAKCWNLQMPPSSKAVLIALADNANDQGVTWPSIPTICTRTCLGRSAVISAIQWLEDHGALRVQRQASRSNRYTVTPETYVEEAHPDMLIELERQARKAPAERSASRTVREPDRSAGEPQQSGSRTSTVRQPDPNRKEPKRTVTQERQHAEGGVPTTVDKRGCRLPEDWTPSPATLAWAAEQLPAVDPASALDEFRDYWRAVPGAKGRKLDWDATFRNRLRELAERRAGHAGSGKHRESLVERAQRAADAADHAAGIHTGAGTGDVYDGQCARLA